MTRTRLAPGQYCPPRELRFAVVTGDGRYIAAADPPFTWAANVDGALLWGRWRDADAFLSMRLGVGRYRYRIVQVREEA